MHPATWLRSCLSNPARGLLDHGVLRTLAFSHVLAIDDLTDLGFKSLFLYRLKQMFLINCICVVGHEQQILQIDRIRITVPLVFDRLDTLKP
ncbi:MAG: hypothetical protein VB862_02495 [Pirellulaceae bacterium]